MKTTKTWLRKREIQITAAMTPFESQSIKLARIGLVGTLLALLSGVISVVFLGIQIGEQVKATNAQIAATTAQYEAIESSVYQDLMSKLLDLDKLLIEKPNLYALLYGKVSNDPDAWKPELIALTDFYLDFFQLVFSQRTRVPALQDSNGADWKTWENAMSASFRDSSALCIKLHKNKQMYGSDFTNLALGNWCAQIDADQ